MARQALNEKAKATLAERIRDGNIHAEEADASKDHIGGAIGLIANGYICGLCGEKIKGKMRILTYEHTTQSGAESTTRYFLDEECYQNAKNSNSKQSESWEGIPVSLN